MPLSGYIASNTGLPVIESTIAGTVWAGRRRVGRIELGGGMVIDPLAPPGRTVTYRQGSLTVKLKRVALSAREAILTDLLGRGSVPCLLHDTGDTLSWDSPVARFESGALRWPAYDAPRSSSVTLVLMDAALREQLWELLQARSPLVLATGAPVVGVDPVRVITVTRVRDERIGADGLTIFTVDYVIIPMDSPLLIQNQNVSGPGVVTWGDWARIDGTMTHRTYKELADTVRGTL